MDTTWTIISGGRLKRDQITERTSFRITTNDEFESILLKTATIKQSIEEGLRRLFSPRNAHSPATFCIEFSSAVVLRESVWRDVELSVTIKDCENDNMLWYFMLMSPEGYISPGNLNEIVSLVANRLLFGLGNVKGDIGAQALSINDNTSSFQRAFILS
jgi:hypothetical protein